MNPEHLVQNYDMTKIKNNASYNGTKMRITDIKRKDGELMSRKEMTECAMDFFLNYEPNIQMSMGM